MLRAAFSSLFSKHSTQKAWLYRKVLQLGVMQEFPGNVKEDFSEAVYDENWMVALDFRKLKRQMKTKKVIPITKATLMINIFKSIKNLLILNTSHFHLPISQEALAAAEFLSVLFL